MPRARVAARFVPGAGAPRAASRAARRPSRAPPPHRRLRPTYRHQAPNLLPRRRRRRQRQPQPPLTTSLRPRPNRRRRDCCCCCWLRWTTTAAAATMAAAGTEPDRRQEPFCCYCWRWCCPCRLAAAAPLLSRPLDGAAWLRCKRRVTKQTQKRRSHARGLAGREAPLRCPQAQPDHRSA